ASAAIRPPVHLRVSRGCARALWPCRSSPSSRWVCSNTDEQRVPEHRGGGTGPNHALAFSVSNGGFREGCDRGARDRSPPRPTDSVISVPLWFPSGSVRTTEATETRERFA